MIKFRYVVCVIWLMMDLRNEPGFLRREFAGSELLLGMHGSPGLRGGQSQKNHHGRPSPLACNMQSSKAKRLHDQAPSRGWIRIKGQVPVTRRRAGPGPGLGVQHGGEAHGVRSCFPVCDDQANQRQVARRRMLV
jgi:hypothetical protein